MKQFIQWCVDRPLLVNFIGLFLLLAGLMAAFSMTREVFPNINMGVVQVKTLYEGASPNEVEKLITIPIERELAEVDNIKRIRSSAIEGMSIISLEAESNVTNMRDVVADVQRAVDRVDDFPEDLRNPPSVNEIKTRDQPIIEVSLAGLSESELHVHAKTIESEILDLPFVARVVRSGWRNPEVWVEVDPQKMVDYDLSLQDVMTVLRRQNVTGPGGTIEHEGRDILLRTTGEFQHADDIKPVVVRANDAGHAVTMADIATIRDGFEEYRTISKTGGLEAVNLIVVMREGGDAINLVKSIEDLTARYEKNGPKELSISLVNDRAYYIERRLNVLIQNGWFGFGLVVITLFIFLNPRIALMTALGIPVAYFGTLFMMKWMGMTINLISMFGLIMVIGIIVDDAIVICENVYRHIEEGMSFRDAAIQGSSEVAIPVISTVLTTIAAFVPLMMMSGIMGKFVWSIPVVVIIALSVSLMEAIIILPSHLAEMGRIPHFKIFDYIHKPKANPMDRLIVKYAHWLKRLVRRRNWIVAGVTLLFIGSVAFAIKTLPIVLFPSKGIEIFFVRVKAPMGVSLEETSRRMEPIERLIGELPKSEVLNFVTQVGLTQNDPGDPFSKMSSNVGQIAVTMTPVVDRKRDSKEIVAELREKTKTISGFEEISFDEVAPGPPVGKPIEIRVRGEEYAPAAAMADEVSKALAEMTGVKDIKTNYELGKEEWRFVVDRAKAGRAGIEVADVSMAIRQAFEGGIATSIKKADEEIDIRVRFPYAAKYDETAIENVRVRDRYGHLVPLMNIVKREDATGILELHHYDRKRLVSVTANIDQKIITPVAVVDAVRNRFASLSEEHPGYTISFGGEFEETTESLSTLKQAFIIAMALIFFILSLQFNSVIQPAIVMLAIPFSIIGVIWTFFIHGEPLSFLAMMGTVGLVGVAVNDSIIVVDFINKLRRKGVASEQAVVQACQMRMRPVLLTTITTCLGLMSVAYGWGGGDPILAPMALSIVWGLAFSTLLTLGVIPCAYLVVEDVLGWLGDKWGRVAKSL